jgi:hypothetical protein
MVRPNKGLAHVDGLQADAEAKRRARAILGTMFGLWSVDEACDELGIRRVYFQELRGRALAGMVAALEPRAAGRPRRVAEVTQAEFDSLRRSHAELERELRLLRARLELALAMPAAGHDKRSAGRASTRRRATPFRGAVP